MRNNIIHLTRRDLHPAAEHKNINTVTYYDFKPRNNRMWINQACEIFYHEGTLTKCLKSRVNTELIGEIY